jgi:hypothetical protein
LPGFAFCLAPCLTRVIHVVKSEKNEASSASGRPTGGSPHTTAQCALRPRRAATCRPGAAFGQAAASCPAPARRHLARPGPASHSWAHQFPPHHTTVRAAPAASTDLPSPGPKPCQRRGGHHSGYSGVGLQYQYHLRPTEPASSAWAPPAPSGGRAPGAENRDEP